MFMYDWELEEDEYGWHDHDVDFWWDEEDRHELF